ncbi:hypothetical protein K437DRAFT_260979 [Tilletiaria anomala UBC 951]|uniref:Uncharacterized protein n=1 Tax=Tilletiaria anomala (strain ATCC 24038 / CBS 436.72 / UBC 951) TaxID=1037660 RepID=A0A066WKA8_TILAU|nr:uncharacterized protein K437DRAFT_260979 [Tilletiaria anomala UBC 951]KDN53003.1 hypothetical protein K437DRAFT_260979 [Tilletiaria anomala UBC 951]
MDSTTGYLDDLPAYQGSSIMHALQAQSLAGSGREGSRGYRDALPGPSNRRPGQATRNESPQTHNISDEGNDDDDYTDSSSISSYDSEEAARLAQQEWDETVRQFQTIVQIMVLPYIGKYFGRKWGYWVFARWKLHGLAPSFFGLDWMLTENSFISSIGTAFFQR